MHVTVLRANELLYLKGGIMESLDIALKGIKAVFIYNNLREGVPKSNGIWENNTCGNYIWSKTRNVAF